MSECNLCKTNERGSFIQRLEYWNLGVCPNQHTLGSLVAILKVHKEMFAELTEHEVLDLFSVVKTGEHILDSAFQPDWYNVQQNGNWEHHLHIHIIPRYKEERLFEGRTFSDTTFGGPVIYTSQLEDEKFIEAMTHCLSEKQ